MTTYAHVLVTLEAFAGMMALALGTGVVFAKFSRPTARIAFSENASEDVLHDMRFVDMIDAKSVPGVISTDHALLNGVGPIPISTPSLAPIPIASDADSAIGASPND